MHTTSVVTEYFRANSPTNLAVLCSIGVSYVVLYSYIIERVSSINK
jgi:hypothetical protein